MDMKKILCILMVLLLGVTIFSACANGADSSDNSSAQGTGKESTAANTAQSAPEESNAAASQEEASASPDGTAPGDPPDGNGGPDGTPPGNPPDGNGGPGGTPPGDPPGGNGGPGGSSGADIDYTGAAEITSAETQSGQTYASTTADESALLIATADAVSIEEPTVTKSGDSNGGDNCNFYGLNAAVLVKDGTTTTITGGTVSSDADGANGVFCYGGNGGQNGAAGDGTTVIIKDTKITTTGSGSGGIMTTGGGITYAYNLDVETSGQSSAAIRTDRGGGTVYVDGGSYTSNGLGSPAIYSTAEIHVANATLISNLSEGVCIEGKNSIALTDCNLTANNTKCNGNATFLDTIMIISRLSANGTDGVMKRRGAIARIVCYIIHGKIQHTTEPVEVSGGAV